MANTDVCIACGRTVSAHRVKGEWVGCVPLTPITVTVGGQSYLLRTPGDVYRLYARLKKRAVA